MADRLEEWRVFAAVAGLRSFSKAAKRLGKSPQSVTRAVAALEERIGTRLLNRTTRSVSLTNDGEHYLERSRRALGEFEALEAPLEAELRGTLSITAPVLYGQLLVVPIVASFLDHHPRVDARLVLLDRVVSLVDEAIDVGVRIGQLPDSSLIARHVGDVRNVLVASPKYLERAGTPRSPDSLAKHACIAHIGTTPVVDRWKLDRPIAVHPRWIVNTAQAAIDLALAGHGIARVISYQVDALVDQKRLRIVLPSFEPPPVPVHLVYPSGRLPHITAAFLDHATPRLRSASRT
jgi:DNA-binding transcriptional LysR family regulator